MTGARYGALGVLNDDRTALVEFLTVGLEAEQEARIGTRPTGEGVLGLLITDPRPLRLASIASHPGSYGFPPHHPPMTSFLGVPIKVRGEVYGNLYLTDKVGWSEFTADDEALVAALALAAGVAVENTRLHQRSQEVAVYEDRDRLARDLHDTVIQRLFAVGLSLQSIATIAGSSEFAQRLETAISDLDDTIRQVRSTIYELSSAAMNEGLRANVLSLVRDLERGHRLQCQSHIRWSGGFGCLRRDRRESDGSRPRGLDEYRASCPRHRGKSDGGLQRWRLPPPSDRQWKRYRYER